MKIIDLLNKIANGEEVPKKILYKYKNKDYYKEYRLKWNKKYKSYYTTKDITPLTHLLADNLWNLNDIVEILEEEKKIPEKLNDNNAIWEEQARDIDYYFKNTINAIIDYLKSKGE